MISAHKQTEWRKEFWDKLSSGEVGCYKIFIKNIKYLEDWTWQMHSRMWNKTVTKIFLQTHTFHNRKLLLRIRLQILLLKTITNIIASNKKTPYLSA